VFSSVNAGPLPPRSELQARITWPRQARRLALPMKEYVWLGFVPTTVRFEGNLFQRLATMPIQYSDGGWHLASEVQARWARLENNLRHCISVLDTASRMLVPMGSVDPPPPSTFGYLRSHKHKYQAERCALTSRDAFVTLMAQCSFSIAYLAKTTDDLLYLSTRWTRILTENGVHNVWVESLRNSPVGDFSKDNPRVGMVINVALCPFIAHVPAFIRAGIPLWFYWGEDGCPLATVADNSQIAKYCPTSSQLSDARVAQSLPSESSPDHHESFLSKSYRTAAEEWADHPAWSDHPLPPWPDSPLPLTSRLLPSDAPPLPTSVPRRESNSPPSDFPEPERYSRQRRGETWRQFFARAAVDHAKREQNESPADRASRLQRVQAQEHCLAPGRRGPVVFIWMDVDGFRIRTRANRGEVDQWWDTYGNSQKIYNAFRNEWDVCTEFDPDSTIDNEFDDDDDDGMWPEERPQTPAAPPQYPPSSPCPPSYKDDLIAVFDHEVAHAGTDNINLLRWAYSRFGFVCATSGTSYRRLEAVPPPWINICQAMAYDLPQNDVPSAIQAPLSDFVSTLLNDGHVPGLLWDLNVGSAHFLGNKTRVIRVSPRHIDKQVLFFLEHIHSNHHPFQLAVPDAATALQCLRESWGPHVEDIIRQLLRLGIPFTTRVPGPLPDGEVSSSREPVVLGYREVGYRPDSVDYAEYETIRRAFCESEQHSRAALLKGGIVWRLVKEILSPGDVLTGPTADVCYHGHALTCPNNQILWDDDLSEDELDMICGVYKIFTGNFIRGQPRTFSNFVGRPVVPGVPFLLVAEAFGVDEELNECRVLVACRRTLVPKAP
jgi:hypothetical protein